MVQMNMGQQERPDIGEGDSHLAQFRLQSGQCRSGSWIDEGKAALRFHYETGDDFLGSRIFQVDHLGIGHQALH